MELSAQFPVKKLCRIMDVNRSGFYKWKKRLEHPSDHLKSLMSREGTPTDNADMEAINGWIKAEIFNDFHLTGMGNIRDEVERYIVFFNEERPAYSLNYLTPKQYREYYER